MLAKPSVGGGGLNVNGKNLALKKFVLNIVKPVVMQMKQLQILGHSTMPVKSKTLSRIHEKSGQSFAAYSIAALKPSIGRSLSAVL
jgi:hypothetical protein